MFVYYDVREQSRRQKIGEYVCEWPPHVTLGLFDTRKPDEFLETVTDIAAQTPAPHVERGDMILVGGKEMHHKKPAAEIHDPSGELHEFQRHLYRQLSRVAMTTRIQPWHFRSHFRPHVSLHHLSSEPLALPEHMVVDSVHVIHNLTPGTAGHHRGVIRHIASLAGDAAARVA